MESFFKPLFKRIYVAALKDAHDPLAREICHLLASYGELATDCHPRLIDVTDGDTDDTVAYRLGLEGHYKAGELLVGQGACLEKFIEGIAARGDFLFARGLASKPEHLSSLILGLVTHQGETDLTQQLMQANYCDQKELMKCAAKGGHKLFAEKLLKECNAIEYIAEGMFLGGDLQSFNEMIESNRYDAACLAKIAMIAARFGNEYFAELLRVKHGVDTEILIRAAYKGGFVSYVETLCVEHEAVKSVPEADNVMLASNALALQYLYNVSDLSLRLHLARLIMVVKPSYDVSVAYKDCVNKLILPRLMTNFIERLEFCKTRAYSVYFFPRLDYLILRISSITSVQQFYNLLAIEILTLHTDKRFFGSKGDLFCRTITCSIELLIANVLLIENQPNFPPLNLIQASPKITALLNKDHSLGIFIQAYQKNYNDTFFTNPNSQMLSKINNNELLSYDDVQNYFCSKPHGATRSSIIVEKLLTRGHHHLIIEQFIDIYNQRYHNAFFKNPLSKMKSRLHKINSVHEIIEHANQYPSSRTAQILRSLK